MTPEQAIALNKQRWHGHKKQTREELLAKVRKRSKEWYHKNRERERAKMRAAYHANPEKQRSMTRDWRLRKEFGITTKQYDEMAAAQNGVCAICGNPEERIIYGKTAKLAVDHNHKTGAVRGLLCNKCNGAIALFLENET